MTYTTIGQATAASLVAGLVLASGVGAQDRPRPRPGAPGIEQPRGDAWFDGLGASIGARVRDASEAEVESAGLPRAGAVVVTGVSDAGPAAKAGLVAGDVIAEFDGERVRSARHLGRLVRESAEGRDITVAIVRGGSRRTLTVTPTSAVAAFVDVPEIQREAGRAARGLSRDLRRLQRDFENEDWWPGSRAVSRRRLGLELVPLTGQLAAYFGVRNGVLVSAVLPESPAASAGLKAGDVLTAVNGRTVRDVEDVLDEVTQSDAAVTVTLTRDKKELTLKVVRPERENRPPTRMRPA
jgi:serine protease Do